MPELYELSLSAALTGLDKKDFSAEELTQAYLANMARDDQTNAYILQTPDHALAQARESDKRRADGDAGPLEGIPLAIKDLFCTRDIETTAGSKILKGFVPPYESTITRKLFEAGAVMLGKANMDEFAMGSANTTSAYGPAINPWSYVSGSQKLTPQKLTPGGSSGGSAAAVAAGLAPAAIGTDTGGSIRQPAAMCGVVGMKPTYGRCSRFGIVAFASSLDQAGPLTRTVEDSARLLQVMAGHDPHDSTSADATLPDFVQACQSATGGLKGLKIGIPKDFRPDGANTLTLNPRIEQLWQQAADWLRTAGAEIVDIRLPTVGMGLAAYYIIAPAEASANLARYDGVRYGFRAEGAVNLEDLYERTRAEGFGAEVKRRILIGTYVLSAGYYDAYYRKAQQVRRLITQDFMTAFESCDAILTPAAPTPAFPINQQDQDPVSQNPVSMYLNDIFTVPVNLAGLPAISQPVGLSESGPNETGLPLGVQMIGRPFEEATLFRLASSLEASAGFDLTPALHALHQG